MLIFLVFTKERTMFTEVKMGSSSYDINEKLLGGSHAGLSDRYSSSYSQLHRATSSQNLSCAPGMSGYITGNSYRNRLGKYYTARGAKHLFVWKVCIIQ